MKQIFLLLMAAVIIVTGCGGGEKLDFKLKGMNVRNIRDKYLAAELKFDRTVRSIVADDGVKATVRVDPADGSDPLEQVLEKASGIQLEDQFLFSGAGSFNPGDYFRGFVRLEAAGKVICDGYFLLDNGVGRMVSRDEYVKTNPPAPVETPTE